MDYASQDLIFGLEGLDFQRTLDQVSPNRFPVASNVIRAEDGRVTIRPGQTTYITNVGQNPGGLGVHTIIRAINPIGDDYYIIGSDNWIYYAPEPGGAGVAVPGIALGFGYSTEPKIFTVAHTQISGDSWVFVGDTVRNRKIRMTDALDLPIGLERPGTLVAAVSASSTTVIDRYENNGAWNNHAGTGAAPANAFDNVIFKEGAFSLRLTSAAGAATGAYYNSWSKANAQNLTLVGGAAATDDDQFHIWLRTDRPDKILEFRIYFVVSAVFTAGTVPGTSATLNTDAYLKVVRPSDFTPAYELALSQPPAAAAVNQILNALSQLSSIDDPRTTIEFIKTQIENSRSASLEAAGGRGTWTEWGVVGRPFPRSEFRRIGNDSTRTWAGVTGVVFVLQTVDNTTGVQVWVDDLTFFGGSGPDSSLVGAAQYDWRYIHYDPRTGAKSLPSGVFATAQKLDLIRQAATLTPTLYAPMSFPDPFIRQRFYRRGGTLPSDWRYVGQNSSNGGAFTDSLSDLSIVAAELLETDNDQPVTTVNDVGTTLYGQPLACIFGPVNDILFGCGDAYRRGTLYWSKPLEFDHWPSFQYTDVCPPAEELLVGFILAGQPFVFSRAALYAVYPNVADAAIVSTHPTACRKGPVERWCIATGFGFCFFVAYDGIYATNGGPEQNITDDWIRPLFHERTVGVPVLDPRPPIDFSTLSVRYLRLFIEGTYLWFLYRDTSGNQQVLRYNVNLKYWEGFFDFGRAISCVYADSFTKRTLLGGTTSGKIYTLSGTTDDSLAINAYFFTGALNQGIPRAKKSYGDVWMEAETRGQTVTLTPYLDNYTTTLATSNFVSGATAGRTRFYADFPPSLGYDIGLKVAWQGGSQPIYIYKGGISYLPQPDEAEARASDWDVQGRLSDKWVKGILLEVDTYGISKSILVQGDGATQTTITVQASGRQVVEITWPEFRARILRILPADETRWILYQFRWIFDEEPLQISRWESQPINHGHTGEQTPLYANISIVSAAAVTLTLTAYRQDGTSVVKTYTLSSTAAAKTTLFVPFEAVRGTLFKYLFTSTAPFYLYREETVVVTQPWGIPDAIRARPFGNDNLDLVRGMQDAGLVAARGGGGAGA
jgi:hypothetical protein